MFGKRTILSVVDYQEQMDTQVYEAKLHTGEFSKDNWDEDEIRNGEYDAARMLAISESEEALKPVPISELDCPKITLVGMFSPDNIPNRYILRGEIYGMEGHCIIEHLDSGISRIAHSNEIYLIPPREL